MANTIIFSAGSEIVRKRINQGLKPIIRVEVKRWKHLHRVTIKARLEPTDAEWVDVAMHTDPLVTPASHSREWDKSALAMWQELTEGIVIPKGAYLTQHLTALMYTYEVEIKELRLKRDLMY